MSAIRSIRAAKRWSQEQLAEELGVDQTTVSRLERGLAEPSRPVRKLLAQLMAEIAPGPEVAGDPSEIEGEAAPGHSLPVRGVAVVHDAANTPGAASLPREQP